MAVGCPRPPRRRPPEPRPGPRAHRSGGDDQRRRAPRGHRRLLRPVSQRSHRGRRHPRGPDRRRRRAGRRWASPSAWRRSWSRPTSASGAPLTRSRLTRAVRRRHPFVRPLMGEGARPPLPGAHRPRHRDSPRRVRDGARGAPGRVRPVRERPHPPPPRRPAPPRRTAGRCPRAAARRPRRLRPNGAHPLGVTGRRRARRHRRHRSTPRAGYRPAAHLTGDPRRPPGRRGQIQP